MFFRSLSPIFQKWDFFPIIVISKFEIETQILINFNQKADIANVLPLQLIKYPINAQHQGSILSSYWDVVATSNLAKHS